MFDYHLHTDSSYCSEGGMTLDFIADSVNTHEHIDGIAVTDHSFAFYFPRDVGWGFKYMTDRMRKSHSEQTLTIDWKSETSHTC